MTRPLPSLLALLLVACNPDVELTEQARVLDSFPYVDCGAIAPGTRQECTVPLFSREGGRVTIFDIAAIDIDYPDGGVGADGGFILFDEQWMSPECGEGDCLTLEGYDDESDEDTLALPVSFAPLVEGYYQAELTIWSNDNETTEEEPLPDDAERAEPIWKVQLRGLARPACGRVHPTFYDFGKSIAPHAEFSTTAVIENCGIVTLSVADYALAGGAGQFDVTSSFPLYILPGLSEDVHISWTVDPFEDGVPEPLAAAVTFDTDAADTLGAQTLSVIANDCASSVLSDWDADSDGWTACGGDCDDAETTTNPSEVERAGNVVDDNCDDLVDEPANPVGTDGDGDGWTELAGDCDDADPAVSPDAVEALNQIDDDCNGSLDDTTDSVDDDTDGYSEREGDCDDSNRLVGLLVAESPDGLDNDCDGIIDEGSAAYDDDRDGFKEIEADAAQADCDDADPWVYLGAFEFCDGYDNDCDRVADEGPDDVAEGACAFLPQRDEVSVIPPAGCASVPGGVGLGSVALAVILGLRRRRRE